GYADLITCAQAGIHNIVASSGTALTEEQIRLVDRFTHTIVLVYDADSAGSKAMMRGVDLVIEQGLEVKVTELPEGEDPDSFVRKNSGKAFQDLIDRAESFLDFKANFFRRMGLLASPEGKVRAIRSIVGTLARMKDELRRNVYLQQVASIYSLPEGVIRRELDSTLGRIPREVKKQGLESSQSGTAGSQAQISSVPVAERDTIKVMLDNGDDVIRFVFTYVDPAMFSNPEAKAVADRLAELIDAGGHFEPSAFLDALEDDAVKRFASSLMMQRYEINPRWSEAGGVPETPDPLKLAEDAVVGLRVRELDHQIDEAAKKFKEFEARGEDTAAAYRELRRLQDDKRALISGGFQR
ncbi:MAG: toprim domain-containing protein, partial [Bacteroidota bacterium]